MHIYLTGFMGCGKSSVGKKLSDISGRTLFDTDKRIEEMDGRRISKIFEQSGEGYFRRLETMVLRELLEMPDCIVSCGGGMVMRDENVDLMKKGGRIVYLTARPETILMRVKNSDKRPILEGNKNIEFITELMNKRLPYYERAADILIPTDEHGTEAVAEMVLNAVKTPV